MLFWDCVRCNMVLKESWVSPVQTYRLTCSIPPQALVSIFKASIIELRKWFRILVFELEAPQPLLGTPLNNEDSFRESHVNTSLLSSR